MENDDTTEDAMTLQDTIDGQLKDAMRQRDDVRLMALRQVKTELLKLKTSGKPFTEEDEKAMLRRLVKQHRESIEAFTKGDRAEMADEETRRLAVIETFLPAQLTGAHLEKAVDDAIAAVGAGSPKDMGAVMKQIKSTGIEADGRTLSETVKRRLAEAAG